MRHPRLRRAGAVVASAALALGLTACAESARDAGSDAAEEGGGEEQGQEQTFVFAASSDPKVLDPAFASDGESFRVARQIFEGLVGTEPGTADPAPLLATSWESTEDGLSHTFQLQEGVTFHDGTEFNAEAVCANFERWNNFEGVLQAENISYYWQKLFKGFGDESVYDSCEAASPTEVTINLKQPFAGFVSAMSLPAFSISSPTALEEYNADEVTGSGEAPQFGAYGTEHPTGTGPFQFVEWNRGQDVVLEANEDYWGEPKPEIDRIVFRIIDDPNARKQALQSGEIDCYDLVAPGDIEALESEGFQILNRPAFNILYLAFNQQVPALQKPEVRQAIAHAINKDALVQATLPGGTEVATQFVPPLVDGYNPDVPTYEYDPERARQLLAEAGEENLTLEFQYPTGVSRPYMPTPEQTFTQIAADLEAVGITVQAEPLKWSPDYLDQITGTPDHGIHLLGWTGDYNDPDNFLGVFFGAPTAEWGFDNPEIHQALSEVRTLPTVEEQVSVYEEMNAALMEYLPGVPLAHPVPSLGCAPNVENYPVSPVQDEVYNVITLSDE